MNDMGLGDELVNRIDHDEFHFATRGLRRASAAVTRRVEEVVRGILHTPSGDCIPALVTLHAARNATGYSHVGRLEIPHDWLEEFLGSMRRFIFRSEHGEFFTQLQVVEDMTPDAAAPDYKARIILMRSHIDEPRH